MVPVSFLNLTLLVPQTWAAPHGIGLAMSVLLAPKTGSSTAIRYVFRSALSAKLMTILEPALLAIKDMTCLMGNVLFRLQITQNLLILDVETGIGKVKSVWLARRIGSSTKMEFVCR